MDCQPALGAKYSYRVNKNHLRQQHMLSLMTKDSNLAPICRLGLICGLINSLASNNTRAGEVLFISAIILFSAPKISAKFGTVMESSSLMFPVSVLGIGSPLWYSYVPPDGVTVRNAWQLSPSVGQNVKGSVPFFFSCRSRGIVLLLLRTAAVDERAFAQSAAGTRCRSAAPLAPSGIQRWSSWCG